MFSKRIQAGNCQLPLRSKLSIFRKKRQCFKKRVAATSLGDLIAHSMLDSGQLGAVVQGSTANQLPNADAGSRPARSTWGLSTGLLV